MKQKDRFANCDGRELVADWHLNRHFFHTFEIDLTTAESLVPEQLDIIEIRPGIALLSIGVLCYDKGHFGKLDSPAFEEVVTAIHVGPDLSNNMATPSMTFFALCVFSNSPDFVEKDIRTLNTPASYVESLKVSFTDDYSVIMEDENGLIASLSNAKDFDFTDTEIWGQHYTIAEKSALLQGIWEWDGRRSENMKPPSNWKLHQHPIFKGLDVSNITRCYRQMMAEPGSQCRERFYSMRAL